MQVHPANGERRQKHGENDEVEGAARHSDTKNKPAILDLKGPRLLMKYASFALSILGACAVPLSLAAQAKPTDIYVSVVDAKGDAAPGLTAADFKVREDGVAREVLKAGPATEPLTVALLVDDSAAARPAIQMMREGLHNFITGLAGKAEISIVTFGERPTIALDYTTDQKRLLDAADHVFPRANSGAYLLEALTEVSRGMEKRKPARPVIAVLMVDSAVEFSNNYYDNVLKALDRGRATLDIISIGQPTTSTSDEIRNRNIVIAQGTERTGGRRDNVIALTATGPKMKQLAGELASQYVVTYARPETLIPPDKIEVTVTNPNLTARARTRSGQTGAR
jgi:VWFA-related protein